MNLTYKILRDHLVQGELIPGTPIAIHIDQTLTQDATGTMAYLQFEAMGIPKVATELSVSYVDHNTLQTGFENMDDHLFLQSIAAKHGIYYSRPANGICHQVHLERFGVPGKTLLGSDSHTPTGGGLGMLAIGAGGLDVAVAMAGGAFHLPCPKVVQIVLKGRLQPWVAAKDIILEVLRLLTVKGGVGKIMEYTGPGVATLSVPQRATITNMGAELGATTSVFPSDELTREYLTLQKRPEAWRALAADADATYDETVEIDLDKLEPMIAEPHSPDKVVTVASIAGKKVNQVSVGSCTNSSYTDLMTVAAALKGKTVHTNTSLTISPGSRQVFETVSREGGLTDLIASGARILECACGPCIGMGQAPNTDGVTIRSFNRNFEGRSGTASGQVYLASPETCAACAINGIITDPRTLGTPPVIPAPAAYAIDDRMIIPPSADPDSVTVVRGPNIRPLPVAPQLDHTIEGELLLKVGDNITTDHIMPAGAKVLPLRSNIPAISEYCFTAVDPTFPTRAKAAGGGLIVGGNNYGQGSSREHAALAPLFLGIRAVLAKGFARIHWSNLINQGIVPLVFQSPDDYDKVAQGDRLRLVDIRGKLERGEAIVLENLTNGAMIPLRHDLSAYHLTLLMDGGLLNHIRLSLK